MPPRRSFSFTNTIVGINRGSLIQALVPDRLLGRIWASQSFIGLGIVPLGALLGGVLGEQIGIPATIIRGRLWWAARLSLAPLLAITDTTTDASDAREALEQVRGSLRLSAARYEATQCMPLIVPLTWPGLRHGGSC
jgi:hypothetical protein